jgi:DNA-binding transcriptional ArsR family regulator
MARVSHRLPAARTPDAAHPGPADDRPAPSAGVAAVTAPPEAQVRAAAATFALLADPTRLKMLWLLGQEELDVSSLAALAGTTPTVASQHLAKLRLAGLVTGRVDGRRRLYSVTGTHLRTLIREALYRADHAVSGIPDDDR